MSLDEAGCPMNERRDSVPANLVASEHAGELAELRPATLKGMDAIQRRALIVATVTDEVGAEYVVSRLGDRVWDLSSLWTAKNRAPSEPLLRWPTDLPADLLDDVRATLYVWLRRGRHNTKTPVGRSLKVVAVAAFTTLRSLAARGVNRFADIRAVHLSDLVSELKQSLAPTTLRSRLSVLDLAWLFRDELLFPMTTEPWLGKTLGFVCGVDMGRAAQASRCGRTQVIPPSVQASLFRYAEACVQSADEVFALRDAGRLGTEGPKAKRIRDAVLYLLQITSGMRNSEATAVKNNSWWHEVRDGVDFHWVTTTEFKTGQGRVDYLVPLQTVEALKLLQRFAAPLQDRLRAEMRNLEELIAQPEMAATGQEERRIALLQRLNQVRATVDNLFLGRTSRAEDGSGKHGRIEVMSNHACGQAMQRLAKAANVTWPLNNHQCRRTFAWTVANSRLGRSGLVIVKWLLKHRSIAMSQLYAANPNQDAALYEEFYEELVQAQAEILESWFDSDQPLGGGGGRKIVRTRAQAIKDKAHLLRHTAETVTIRSTGHSWCLAEQSGCVGEGIYEAIRCGGCSQGVIDADHKETWQQIHLHNLQLAEVSDCGPAAQQRVRRDIAASAAVLRDLKIPLPATRAEFAGKSELSS